MIFVIEQFTRSLILLIYFAGISERLGYRSDRGVYTYFRLHYYQSYNS